MKNNNILSSQFTEAQRKHHKGDINNALRIYEVILKQFPDFKSAHVYRLLALAQIGKGWSHQHEAIDLLNEHQNFGLPDLISLSIYFKTVGLYPQQLETLKRAHEKFPTSPAVRANLGNYYLQIGQLSEAKKHYISVIDSLKSDVAIPLNLCRIAISESEFDEAENYLNLANNVSPGFSEINYLRAVINTHDCDYAASASNLITSLKKNIAHRDSWNLLKTLPPFSIGEIDFNDFCQRILKNSTQDIAILFAAYYICRYSMYWDYIEPIEKRLTLLLDRFPNFDADVNTVFTSLLTNLPQKAIQHVARLSWKRVGSRMQKLENFNFNKFAPGKKIRIGYLSSDLRDHVVSRIVTCVIERHDHNNFEVFAYSNFGDDGSNLRERLNKGISQWVNTADLSNEALALKINSDGIDILVDLNGITRGTRVSVFEYRPAPIQITWLGMPGTLGAGDKCDYIIVDNQIIDSVNLDGFDEKFICLPGTYVPIDKINLENLILDKTEFDLPNDKFVYSAFTTHHKYHPEIIKCWSQILSSTEDSVIAFQDHGDNVNKKISDLFVMGGIDLSRLYFLKPLEHTFHIKRLGTIDCALETWPYGSGGTCVDSIRAGTPMVALRGSQFHSRVGSSICNASGLNQFIAHDFYSYTNIAIGICQDFKRNVSNKLEIHNLIKASNIDNVDLFVKNIETAFQYVYKKFVSNDAPANFTVN